MMTHIRSFSALLIAASLAISACALTDRAISQPSSVTRQFNPSAQYIEGVPYPEEILDHADTDLVPLACTPEYFSWSGTDHEFFDPSTQERHFLTDPRMEVYLESARQLNPGKSILSISLCESNENSPLIFYRVGPCGGGCAGVPNIAQVQQDDTLALLATVEPDGDGPYYACSALQLSKRGDLYLSCLGEGTALIRHVSLDTGEISVILRCDFASTSPACLRE